MQTDVHPVMASSNFIPDREAELLAWARAFGTLLNTDPVAYGVTPDQAAHFDALLADFEHFLGKTRSGLTNTSAMVAAKNTAKKALIAEARALGRQIRADRNVTNEQRIGLGLTRETEERSRVPVPAGPPEVHVTGVKGKTVSISLKNTLGGSSKARPPDVLGATIFSFVGRQPPDDPRAWTFHGQTTRTRMKLQFDWKIPAGETVWISACWINPRLEPGPMSKAIAAQVLSGLDFSHGQLRRAA